MCMSSQGPPSALSPSLFSPQSGIWLQLACPAPLPAPPLTAQPSPNSPLYICFLISPPQYNSVFIFSICNLRHNLSADFGLDENNNKKVSHNCYLRGRPQGTASHYPTPSSPPFSCLPCVITWHQEKHAVLNHHPPFDTDDLSLGHHSLSSRSSNLDCQVPLVLPDLVHALPCPLRCFPVTWELWQTADCLQPSVSRHSRGHLILLILCRGLWALFVFRSLPRNQALVH